MVCGNKCSHWLILWVISDPSGCFILHCWRQKRNKVNAEQEWQIMTRKKKRNKFKVDVELGTRARARAHTHIYIYIYIYILFSLLLYKWFIKIWVIFLPKILVFYVKQTFETINFHVLFYGNRKQFYFWAVIINCTHFVKHVDTGKLLNTSEIL